MNITLIGFPASGKSKVGEVLAEKLNYEFLDTDKLIEKIHKKRLQEIVDSMTNKEFKKLEEKAILSIKKKDKTIISTGGSVVYSPKSMKHLRSISTVVYLQRSFGNCYKKIKNSPDRGLVGMDPKKSFKENLKNLFEKREPLYEKYSHIIFKRKDHSEPDAEKIVALLELGNK